MDLDFSDLQFIEIPVVGPDKRRYVLREASGDAVAKFTNARTRCVSFQDGKISAVNNQGDLEAYLVSLCLFETDADGAANLNRPVDLKTIRSWPARAVKPIYDKAKEISEIDKENEEQAKNEPSGTETGSDLPTG